MLEPSVDGGIICSMHWHFGCIKLRSSTIKMLVRWSRSIPDGSLEHCSPAMEVSIIDFSQIADREEEVRGKRQVFVLEDFKTD